MSGIERNPARSASVEYDLVVIGGGIVGAMTLLEASRAGYRCALLERDDFGGATSLNSLRIVHGGLRYLQKLDLKRFFLSVSERRWLMSVFSELTTTLPCLMPLYGDGLRRPSVLRAALLANDLLSAHRNTGVPKGSRIPGGKLVGTAQVKRLFPLANDEGLQGGAVWSDGCLRDSQRLIMETLLWACERGAVALNYMEATALSTEGPRVSGVTGRDVITGSAYDFRASMVINATGPWSRQLASAFDRDIPALFRKSIAWNVLFDRPPLSEHAVAVSARGRGRHVFFAHQMNQKLLVGTGHAAAPEDQAEPRAGDAELSDFIAELNAAVPGLALKKRDTLRVFSGFLPAQPANPDRLTTRDMVHDHGLDGGPRGLYSVAGIKLTTAHALAHRLIRLITHREKSRKRVPLPALESRSIREIPVVTDFETAARAKQALMDIVASESVVHLEDLLFRRLNLIARPDLAIELAPEISSWIGWEAERSRTEIEKIRHWIENESAHVANLSGEPRRAAQGT